MKAYRIGRIQQPWLNFEPPIRGGVYRQYVEKGMDGCDYANSKQDDKAWSTGSVSSSRSTPSVEDRTNATEHDAAYATITKHDMLDQESANVGCNLRTAYTATQTEFRSPNSKELPSSRTEILSRAEHTAAWEQQEVIDGKLAYPSLNIESQRAIAAEYQTLHQRINDEGFYECRYEEYGKDALRWALLFGVFLFLLNTKRYLTSALFLGMFWVRQSPLLLDSIGILSLTSW